MTVVDSGTGQVARSKTGTHEGQRWSFRADIEGLRGIAVLLVVFFHAGVPGMDGGFIGVDVFFVLSGYLITGILVNEVKSSGRIDLIQFYARRARRLLPASALMVVVTLLAAAVILSPLEQDQVARSAIAASIYLSNMHFMRAATNYFAADSENNPLLHTWSLAVEEQFYFVWPLVLWLCLRSARSSRRGILVITGLSVASFVGCLWLTEVRQPWAFFGSPARAWEFGLGALASFLPATALQKNLRSALGWVGLILICGAAVMLTGESAFPGFAAVIPVVGTAAVLVAGAGPTGDGLGKLLSAPVLQFLGKHSYSWYLWHWPFLVLASALVPGLSLSARIGVVIVSLGVAAVAHALVENPIRFSPRLVARPRLSIGLAVVLTATGAGFGGTAFYAARAMMGRPSQEAYARAVQDKSKLYHARCFVGYADSRPRECVFGDPAAATTVVLFGDSHAGQWFPAIEQIANNNGWRLVVYVKSACPAAGIEVYNPSLKRIDDSCGVWQAEVLRRVAEMKPAAVILGSTFAYVKGPGRTDGFAQLSYADWEAGTRTTLESLSSMGVNAILLRDTPRPGFDVPVCLSRVAHLPWRDSAECALDRDWTLDPNVYKAEVNAARSVPGVTLVDLTEYFCDDSTCPPVMDEHVVYRDHSHVTATYAAGLTDAIARHIVPVVSSGEVRSLED